MLSPMVLNDADIALGGALDPPSTHAHTHTIRITKFYAESAREC